MTDPLSPAAVAAVLDFGDALTDPQPEPRVHVPPTAWHARRLDGFGASDVPILLALTDRRAADALPSYLAARAKPIRTRFGAWPRVMLERCGRAPLAAGPAAAIGSAREQELLAAWSATLGPSDVVVAETVRHSSSVPEWMWPHVDRSCPRLAVSLDAWALDVLGDTVVVETKCSRDWRDDLPWYWRDQVLAQLAATGHELGLVVCGQGWSRSMDERGPIDCWPVARDAHAIAEIRASVVEAWSMVEACREAQRKAGTV